MGILEVVFTVIKEDVPLRLNLDQSLTILGLLYIFL